MKNNQCEQTPDLFFFMNVSTIVNGTDSSVRQNFVKHNIMLLNLDNRLKLSTSFFVGTGLLYDAISNLIMVGYH